MRWTPEIAKESDIPQLSDLISRSSFELQKNVYTADQIKAALGPVFGVDKQLIEDRTYFVVKNDGKILGCGGWSFRESMFGGDNNRDTADFKLSPRMAPARVRAFFVDPDYARQGIGSAIMRECERAIAAMGFTRVEISSTLIGEPLYAKFSYDSVERYKIPLERTEPMEVVKMTKSVE